MSSKAMPGCFQGWIASAVAGFVSVGACSPEPTIDEIRRFQEVGRFAETIEPLQGKLEESPDDPELNHLYGVALLQAGQAALAIWPLRKSSEDPDRAVDDGLLLAQATLAGGSPDDAIAVANRVLEIAPDRVDVMRLLIAARLKARQNEEALVDVERLLELKPGDPDALTSRLVALLSLDRTEEAEQTLGEVAEAVKNLEGGYEWEPRVCGGTATFLKEKGDPEAAETVWNDCLEQFPVEERIVFSAVEFFAEISKPERAIEILRDAYEAEPTSLNFAAALANRLAVSNRADEAERILLAATEDGVNDSRAWFAVADFYEQRDEFAKAAEAMQNGLALMGEGPPLLVAQYIDLLIRQGEHARAEELLASFEGEPMISNMLRGRLLLARGNAAEALDALQDGLRLWPDNAVARELVAQAYEQLGNYDRAVTEYAEALRSVPGDRDALFPLLRLLDVLGREEEAVAVLSRYWREKPRDPESLLWAIRLAGRAGDQERLDAVIKRLETNPRYRAPLIAELAAIRASRAGPAAAIEIIRNAKLDLTQPANGVALLALVDYLVAEGRQDEALRAADAAHVANPDEPLFHELRAHALRASGEAEPAREALERAVALDPRRASALGALAVLAAERGDRTAAIEFYDRANRADPADSSYAWEAILLLGSSDQNAEVERRLDALLIADPTHAEALDLRARQLRTRDPERALTLARRAARIGAGPDALELLGQLQLERGDAAQAVDVFRHSVESWPDRPSAHYWLGMALVAAGDVEGARSELNTALEAESFPEKEDAQAQLAQLGVE